MNFTGMCTRAKLYNDVHEKIEKLTKTVYLSIVQMNIGIVFIPKCLACYWQYYTTDLKNDAFQQIFTMS